MQAINRVRFTPKFMKDVRKGINSGGSKIQHVQAFIDNHQPTIKNGKLHVSGKEIVVQTRIEKLLDRLTRETVAGLGIRSLQEYVMERYAGVTRAAIKNYLQSDETMQKIRTKPAGHHRERRRGNEGATKWAVERWPNSLGADVIKFATSWNAPVKYALMVVHIKTGYPWCVEIEGETLTSKATSKKMSTILTDCRKRFGDPPRLQVDRGSEFKADFMELTERRGIQLIKVDKENTVERKNSIFQRYLIFLRQHHDWDKAFSLALKKLRALPSRITGRAPGEVKHWEVKSVKRTFRKNKGGQAKKHKFAVGDLVQYIKRNARGFLHKSYELQKDKETWAGPYL